MEFLRAPLKGVWLAARISEEDLRKKVLNADVCISDLDDTDAYSPAKKLARSDFWPRLVGNKKYRSWLRQVAQAKIRMEGKEAESHLWQEYVKLFLPKWLRKRIAEEMFPPEVVKKMLFPGVENFYSLLKTNKVYASRNIVEVVEQFGNVLGFDENYGELYDKKKFVENFVQQHPQFQRYIIKGDSEEDKEIKNVLQSCERSKKIEYCLSLYRADKPMKENHGFGVEHGKDLSDVIEIVWGKT